ncbi:hypothetical protein CA54_31560 [Symmachiella macrocystis]|uniref:VWFA domain-containing protein n=1 Tax=Symmachiella macrocystis TaxID=2527985 RepID=A0A5C6BRG5_9PLAN|nr:BatA domain-containing protein [Symmachiella macrocystis]TWU14312.1 hypothetical protein CA54_31560 [Symmachiella macrocystis]
MSFLSGIFLWALPLVAVPVLIHLFNRRRREVVQWGAMQFLSDSLTKKRRIMRVDDLILMLLRALAILMIVAALAQPMVQSQWFGSTAGRDVVIVIDTSLSMSRELDQGTVFDRAIERANDLLAELSDGDSVRVLLAGNRPHWLTSSAAVVDSATTDQLKHALSELEPTLATADLFSAVQMAADAVPASSATSRTIAVLTDGSRHGWQSDATAAWTGVERLIEQTAIPTVVNVLELADVDTEWTNISVDQLQTSRKLVGVEDEFTVRAVLTNRGPQPTAAMLLNWESDGEPLGVSSIEPLAPGQSVTIPFQHEIEEAGVSSIQCRIDGSDNLNADNVGSLVVEAVERVPLLILRPQDDEINGRSESSYLLAALGQVQSIDDDDEQAISVFQPTVAQFDELESLRLSDYYAVVMADVPQLSDETTEQLSDYVRSGGGLWIALGEQADAETYNTLLYQEGQGVAPLLLEEPTGDANNRDKFDMVHPPEAEHVATELLGDTQRLDVDEVKIYRRHQFRNPGSDSGISVLLRSDRGAILAAEKYSGEGRVIAQCMPVGLSWSNLPLCQVYVPMVHEWLWYLSEPAVAKRNLQPGEPLLFSQDVGQKESTALLQPPVGEPIELLPELTDRHEVFEYHRAFLPGNYLLTVNPGANSEVLVPFYVQRDAAESDLTLLDEPQHALLAQAGGLRFTEELLSVPAGQTVEIRREPIWSLLLTAFLLFIVVEMLISAWSTNRRYAYRAAPTV